MEDAVSAIDTGSSSHSGTSKKAIDISSSFVKEQWGHFHSKRGIGFESCAVLPVVEALPFAPIVNVCLQD
jgi:hypothetical protein